MIAYNVDEQDLCRAAYRAGVVLTGQRQQRDGTPIRSGRGLRFTLLPPQDKRYQRRGRGGQWINALCWHGHYAFMAALFERVPTASLVTTMVRYDGKAAFDAFAERTGDRNIGSRVQPMSYRDACNC